MARGDDDWAVPEPMRVMMKEVMIEKPLRNCGDCGVKPGELHQHGCDVERCALCGGQAFSCECIYTANGMENLEEDHPEIFENGPTDDMYPAFDALVEKYGGRLPWTGEFPGSMECREFNLWCRWVDMPKDHVCTRRWADCRGKHGWVTCDKSHPDAREDLNRLAEIAEWDKVKRRFVLRIAEWDKDKRKFVLRDKP